MSARAIKKSRQTVRYEPEDIEPRDRNADEVALDRYLERNKDVLNASIGKADAEYRRSESFTLKQVMADVRAQKQRRHARKK